MSANNQNLPGMSKRDSTLNQDQLDDDDDDPDRSSRSSGAGDEEDDDSYGRNDDGSISEEDPDVGEGQQLLP